MERQHNALDQRVDSKHQRQYAKDPNKQIQAPELFHIMDFSFHE